MIPPPSDPIDYQLPRSFEELNRWFEYCAGKGQKITPESLQRLVDEMRKVRGLRKYRVTPKLVDRLYLGGWIAPSGQFAIAPSPPPSLLHVVPPLDQQIFYLQKLWEILRVEKKASKKK